ncbi:pentapeptide repeat-containing protein [Marichromatium gracile]|uniref:pentapeptide repeat-containing protein n=1 Tax=Marichromatium gracile TaxID=1048 RepID=UPI001903BBBE|nr:pentapeptide repeat-containing protein [Marichromatium gracile]MBK1708934.1 hypothetical protein [Marichromatium gracile]
MSRRWDGKENLWALEEQDVLAKLALLRASADDAARHVRNLYVTFLLFSFYIAVIVFSTDDEQLLRETGATLPLLDIELPLLGFYSFIPWLVLFFHAHLLLQFFQLSRKLFNLDALLLKLPEAEERTYRELPFPLVFSYVLIGRHQPGLIRLMLRVVVKVTMILLPILLLAAIQWRFLPYHSFWITLDHQLVITLDLLLIALLWPRLSSRSGRWRIRWPTSRWLPRKIGRLVRPNRRWQRRGARVPPALALIFLGAIWGLMVPPGGGIEWMIGENQQWINWLFQRNLTLRERVLMGKAPPAEVLYAAHIDTDEERTEIWKDVGQALDLRHRDLRYADFWRATLWDVDLREAQLQGADLSMVQLQGADLSRAQLQGADLRGAQLQGADLSRAQLQGADLGGAQLQSADLGGAQLQSANLGGAQLQSTNLGGAQLQGANFNLAQLQSANLSEARLQGTALNLAQLQEANLRGAQLQGADLSGAQLQGADLSGAQLQGADLNWAQLQGADLSGAQLQGAYLNWAQLQGAYLREAQLQGANLNCAQLQGADLREAQLQGAYLNWAQLQGANLSEAQLQGSSFQGAIIYSTDFDNSNLTLSNLRLEKHLPIEIKTSKKEYKLKPVKTTNHPLSTDLILYIDPIDPIDPIDIMSLAYRISFYFITQTEYDLKIYSDIFSESSKKRISTSIETFWSIAFDLPLTPTVISPAQAPQAIYDQCGLFANWPDPPSEEEFLQEQAGYLANLACSNQYIAARMIERSEANPILAEAIQRRASEEDCPILTRR